MIVYYPSTFPLPSLFPILHTFSHLYIPSESMAICYGDIKLNDYDIVCLDNNRRCLC